MKGLDSGTGGPHSNQGLNSNSEFRINSWGQATQLPNVRTAPILRKSGIEWHVPQTPGSPTRKDRYGGSNGLQSRRCRYHNSCDDELHAPAWQSGTNPPEESMKRALSLWTGRARRNSRDFQHETGRTAAVVPTATTPYRASRAAP